MWRSRLVTTSSKDGNWSKQPRNTGASFSTARKTAPSRNGPTKLRKLPPASTASSRLLSNLSSAVVHRMRHRKAPAGLDFDIWTGPAQKEDFHKNQFTTIGTGLELRKRRHRKSGVHQMDIARWMIREHSGQRAWSA